MNKTATAVPASSRRHFRRIASFAAIVTLASGGLVGFASASNATTANDPFTFECYHGLSASLAGGNLKVDTLPIADDGRVTFWAPVVYRWTGHWTVYKVGSMEQMTDSAWGELAEYPQVFHVPVNSYYAVRIVTNSTGDARAQATWAHAETGGAPINSAICRS